MALVEATIETTTRKEEKKENEIKNCHEMVKRNKTKSIIQC